MTEQSCLLEISQKDAFNIFHFTSIILVIRNMKKPSNQRITK